MDLRDAYEGLLPKIDQCRRRIDSLEKDKLDLSDQVLAVEEEKLKVKECVWSVDFMGRSYQDT